MAAGRNITGYYSGRKAHGCLSGLSNSMMESCRGSHYCWPIANELHLWFPLPPRKVNGFDTCGAHPSIDLNASSGYADRANSDG
jgi:hypothetical protein